MRIVIAGAGEMGFHLAKLLTAEEQDIVIIDSNASVLEYVSQHLDVNTVRGSSTSPRVLKEANIGKADLLIAVTSIQETNITTCILGKSLGAKKTIARISNTALLHARECFPEELRVFVNRNPYQRKCPFFKFKRIG